MTVAGVGADEIEINDDSRGGVANDNSKGDVT